jgi:energy-coupling factor transporter transmembrane protein EcfT
LLETIRNNLNLDTLAIAVAAFVVLVFVVAWVAWKAEGRPVRDTFALFAAGLVLLIIFFPIGIAFTGHNVSQELGWLLWQIEKFAFFAAAYLCWWAGNRLSHRVRARKKTRSEFSFDKNKE